MAYKLWSLLCHPLNFGSRSSSLVYPKPFILDCACVAICVTICVAISTTNGFCSTAYVHACFMYPHNISVIIDLITDTLSFEHPKVPQQKRYLGRHLSRNHQQHQSIGINESANNANLSGRTAYLILLCILNMSTFCSLTYPQLHPS